MGRSQDRDAARVGAFAGFATASAAGGLQSAAAEGMESYNRNVAQGGGRIAEVHLFFLSLGVMIMVTPLDYLMRTKLFNSTGIWDLLGIIAASFVLLSVWLAVAEKFLEHGIVGEGIAFNAILPFAICGVVAHFAPSTGGFAFAGIWLLSRFICEALFEEVRLLQLIRKWVMTMTCVLIVLSPIVIVIGRIIVGWKA